MIRRSRLLLLLFAVVLTLALAGVPHVSATDGLICGGPNDPIPCSTFNHGICGYYYDPATNCCLPSWPQCEGVCC